MELVGEEYAHIEATSSYIKYEVKFKMSKDIIIIYNHAKMQRCEASM